MKYRLLIIDIDGTLIGKDWTISAEDKEAVAKACRSGVQVALSTGRGVKTSLRIIEELSLDGNHIFFDGALVSNPEQGSEVYAQPLSEEMVKQAVEFAHQNDIYLELYSVTHYFVEQETRSADVHREFFGIEPTLVDFTALWKERIIKGGLFVSSPEEEAKARRFQLQFDGNLRFSRARTPAYPGIEFINVVDPEVSKGRALEVLASHLGISLSEVMAIGDGSNDIPLLATAGLAIAMGNALDEVKALADYVTLDVYHSGVAAAIERFLG